MAEMHLFVYGTLQESHIRQLILGRETATRPARLKDFDLTTIKFDTREYALAEPAHGRHVEGELIQVNDEDLAQIDAYETTAYTRKQVVVEDGTKAWVYCKP